MKIEEYEAAAEAILFAMGDSVELKKLAFALQVGEREAELIVRNLADRYQASNCGLQILELEGAYQICTKPSQYEYLIRIAKQPRKQVLTDVWYGHVPDRTPIVRLPDEAAGPRVRLRRPCVVSVLAGRMRHRSWTPNARPACWPCPHVRSVRESQSECPCCARPRIRVRTCIRRNRRPLGPDAG